MRLMNVTQPEMNKRKIEVTPGYLLGTVLPAQIPRPAVS